MAIIQIGNLILSVLFRLYKTILVKKHYFFNNKLRHISVFAFYVQLQLVKLSQCMGKQY